MNSECRLKESDQQITELAEPGKTLVEVERKFDQSHIKSVTSGWVFEDCYITQQLRLDPVGASARSRPLF
jgi:hypothetical protein